MTSCPWRLHPPGTRRDIPSGCWRQDTQGWTSLRNRRRQRTERLRVQPGRGLVASYRTRKVVFMYCFGGWNLFLYFPCPQQYITQLPSCRLAELEACRLSSARGNTPTVDCRLTRRRYIRSHRKTFSELRQKSSGALDGSWTHQDTERLIDKRGEWKNDQIERHRGKLADWGCTSWGF